jgi:hypothetical protein
LAPSEGQQQVEMLRHQNIAQEAESQLDAQFRQCGGKLALESLGIENLRAVPPCGMLVVRK